MHPIRVHGGYVFARANGYVCASGCTGGVAGKRRVGGFENGVVGSPFSLWHPCGGILHGLVAIRIVAMKSVNWIELFTSFEDSASWPYPGYHVSPTV